MKPKIILFLLIFSCCTKEVLAQFLVDPQIGIDAGAGKSKISGINTVVISETYYTHYHLWDDWTARYPHLGIFVKGDFSSDAKIKTFLFFEANYTSQGGHLTFNNDSNFGYAMNFNYEYVNGLTMIGLRFVDCLYLSAGLQYAVNVTPDQIYYTSESSPGYQQAFGTDLDQQQQLRNVFRGKSDFGFIGAAGYSSPKDHFGFEIRGHLGTKNVVDVEYNPYNFVPHPSKIYNVEVLLTYGIDLFKKQ